jgi:hypothetical protein
MPGGTNTSSETLTGYEDDDMDDPHSSAFPEHVQTELTNLREEVAKKVSPECMQLGDYLLTALDLKYQARICKANKTADEALRTAREARDIATQADQKVDELQNQVSSIDTTVTEQGKQIAELQLLMKERSRSLETGACSSMIIAGTKEVSPTERVKVLQLRYTTLLQKAENTNTFVLGRKQGASPATRVAAQNLMDSFFPGIKCLVTKPESAEFARVMIPDQAAAKKVGELIKTNWVELGSQGWWMSPDSPEQLRKLEARARSFLAAAKKKKEAFKKAIGYVEIERGFFYKNGVEIMPLFFVPPQVGKNWDPLFELFAKRVEVLQDCDLLAHYNVDCVDFQLNWMEKSGTDSLKCLAADVRAIRAIP